MRCHRWIRLYGRLEDYPRRTRCSTDLLEDFTELAAQGYTREQIAERLRMKLDSMDRALLRLTHKGVPVPTVPKRQKVSV